jgi:hypothetical protein
MVDIPSLRKTQPYFGTTAQKHGDYLAAANEAANAVESIYYKMIGAEKGRDGKPLLVRDVRDLKELEGRIREAEEAIKTVMKSYPLGTFREADNVILYARARLLSSVQGEYNRIKARMKQQVTYDKQIKDYEKEQAQRSLAQREARTESDLKTLNGQEKALYDFKF